MFKELNVILVLLFDYSHMINSILQPPIAITTTIPISLHRYMPWLTKREGLEDRKTKGKRTLIILKREYFYIHETKNHATYKYICEMPKETKLNPFFT